MAIFHSYSQVSIANESETRLLRFLIISQALDETHLVSRHDTCISRISHVI